LQSEINTTVLNRRYEDTSLVFQHAKFMLFPLVCDKKFYT